MAERLDERSAARLLAIARGAVSAAAKGERYPLVLTSEPDALRGPGAAFVTLRQPDGSLRGCIGSLAPRRPLAEDVVENATSAATRDPRFAPVSQTEAPALAVSVAILSPFEPLDVSDEAGLLAQLRPGVDGLLLRDRGRRALFLPQVWDQLPEPRAFVGALKRKAGLPEGPLSPAFAAERFTVEPIGK